MRGKIGDPMQWKAPIQASESWMGAAHSILQCLALSLPEERRDGRILDGGGTFNSSMLSAFASGRTQGWKRPIPKKRNWRLQPLRRRWPTGQSFLARV